MNLEKIYPHKRVLITGAGSGLGKALALEFAKRKWNIMIANISQKKLYIITQPDAKAVWWFKRHFPILYAKVLSFAYKRGIIYAYLGVKPQDLK